jgi:hypothetical protein
VHHHRAGSQVDNSSLIRTPGTTHASDPDPTRPLDLGNQANAWGCHATKNLQIESLGLAISRPREASHQGSFLKKWRERRTRTRDQLRDR